MPSMAFTNDPGSGGAFADIFQANAGEEDSLRPLQKKTPTPKGWVSFLVPDERESNGQQQDMRQPVPADAYLAPEE